MATKFEYRHEFSNVTQVRAYGAILKWLEAEGSKVEGTAPSASIEATHGSLKTVSAWKRDAKKKLSFSVQPNSDGCVVLLQASPSMMYADDVNSMRNEIFVNWGLLAEEIWAFVEGRPAPAASSEFTQAKEKLGDANRALGRKMMVYGAVFLVLGILLSVVIAVLLQGYGFVVVFVPVVGALMVFWGAIKMRYGRH